jgi:hypothetical protein
MKGYCTMSSIGSYGRFANMLFQVAGVIGIARKNGLQPVFKPLVNLDHKERFGSNEDIDLEKYFVNPLPRIPDGLRWNDRPVEWGYQDVRLGPGNWNFSGHFQSFKYFQHCFDEVKYYMRMKEEPGLQDLCAIHVRLGDYDGAYHPRLDLAYYIPAINLFPAATNFMIFSDDQEKAEVLFEDMYEKTGRKYNFYYSDEDGYINDFRLMKSCRHFVIGNSSYSAMAAILGEAKDKRVIAPSPWFGPRYTNITGKDIYCDGWAVIDYEKQKIIL